MGLGEIDLLTDDVVKSGLFNCFICSGIHHKVFLCLYRYFHEKEMK